MIERIGEGERGAATLALRRRIAFSLLLPPAGGGCEVLQHPLACLSLSRTTLARDEDGLIHHQALKGGGGLGGGIHRLRRLQSVVSSLRDGIDMRRLQRLGTTIEVSREIVQVIHRGIRVLRDEHIPRPRVDPTILEPTLQQVEQRRLVQVAHHHHVGQVLRVARLELCH